MYQPYPMNRLNENITSLVSFFFISDMRIFLYHHTGPEKYPRNITPYKIITLQNIIGKLPEIWWITSWQPSSKKRTCSHLLWTAILELTTRGLTLWYYYLTSMMGLRENRDRIGYIWPEYSIIS